MSPDDGSQEVDGAEPGASPKKKKLFVLGLIAGIMLAEGVGVYVVVRMSAEDPAAAEAALAAELENPEMLAETMDAELVVGECDGINRKSGRSIVVHMALSVRVAAENRERAAKLVELRESTVKDRVQMILRSADPQHLNEPNLDTLKRQIKFELDQILGDDELVLEVLVTQILQTRSRD